MADFEDLVYSVLCDVMKTFDASSRSARMKQSMNEIEGGADVGRIKGVPDRSACCVLRFLSKGWYPGMLLCTLWSDPGAYTEDTIACSGCWLIC